MLNRNTPLRRETRAMIVMNVRAFFRSGRNIAFVPLTLLALAAALWPYIGSPFLPVCVAVLAGLEPLFANILFASPREFEVYAVGPVPWEQIVLAKNITAIFVFCVMFLVLSLALLYTVPDMPSASHCVRAMCGMGTLLFPLLHIGNGLSVRTPRRRALWSFEDVARALLLLAYCGILIIPHLIFVGVFDEILLSVVYTVIMGAVWFFYSVPASARMIREATTTISALR